MAALASTTQAETTEVANVTEKRCSHCGYTKPLGFFYKKARGRFGRQEWCKRCMAKKSPMSAEEETMARGKSGTGEVAMSGNASGGAGVMAPATTIISHGESQTDTTTKSVTETSVQPTTETITTTTDGRVSFREWLRITASEIFATPEFVVLRVQGTSSFTIHLGVQASERMRKLAEFVPAGAIQSNMIEFITRAITDSLLGDQDILGYTYY